MLAAMKAERGRKDSPREPLERVQPFRYLDLVLLGSSTENQFVIKYVFKATEFVVICHSIHGKLTWGYED